MDDAAVIEQHPAYACCCCGQPESDQLKLAGWAKGSVVTCMCERCAAMVVECCKALAAKDDDVLVIPGKYTPIADDELIEMAGGARRG